MTVICFSARFVVVIISFISNISHIIYRHGTYIIVHPGPCSLAGAWQNMCEKKKNMYKQTLKIHIFI